MEALIAVLVVVLSAAGLAVGLAVTGRPLRASCDGATCASSGACPGCPKRKAGDGR